MRSEKVKTSGGCGGLEKEHNRSKDEKEKFGDSFSPNIDWNKSDENIYLIRNNNWSRKIKEELHSHGIEKWRKDAVLLVDSFYTASPEVMNSWNKEKQIEYFKDCVEFHERHYGHVINAVIHFDETSPHIHVDSIPIVQKENGTWKLSAKEIFGNKTKMRQLQTDYWNEIGQKYGLERGIEKSYNVHSTVFQHLAQKNEELQETISNKEEYSEFLESDLQTKSNTLKYQEELISKKQLDISNLNNEIEDLEQEKEESEHSISDLKYRINKNKEVLEDQRTKIKELSYERQKLARECIPLALRMNADADYKQFILEYEKQHCPANFTPIQEDLEDDYER